MPAGTVQHVEESLLGSELTVDVSGTGATTITVDDPTDFQPEGGELLIGGVEKGYATIDEATGVITLDVAIGTVYLAGEPVLVLPQSTERFAHVLLEGDEETLQARIPHGLYDRLPVGARDPNLDELELVELSRDPNGELFVLDVLEREPFIDGSFVDPTTLPPPATSDGLAPAVSPTPTLIGGIRSLFVLWTPVANADPVTYEVHLGTGSGFTPSAGTFVGEEDGTLSQISTLPGTTTPLEPGTVYYVRLIAKDEDGAAAAGAEASGTPGQVTGPDIAALSVSAANIIADNALFAKLQTLLVIANTLKTAESGQRVEIDTAGMRLVSSVGQILVDLPTDPIKSPTFAGDVVAGGLDVLGDAVFRGVGNIFDTASMLTFASQQADPSTKPTLTIDHERVTVSPPANTAIDDAPLYGGIFYDASGFGSQPTFLCVDFGDVGSVNTIGIVERKASDGTVVREAPTQIVGGGSLAPRGIARLGTNVFVLYVENDGAAWKLAKYLQSDLSLVSTTNITSSLLSAETNQAGGLGTDGTHLVVGRSELVSGVTYRVELRKFSSTPAFVSAHDTGITHVSADLNLYVFGVVWDGSQWWIDWAGNEGEATRYIDAVNASTYALVANRRFRPATVAGVGGGSLAWDGARFWGVTYTGDLTRFSTWDWTTESAIYWVGYTWRHEGSAFESLVSPRQSINLTDWRRARLSVSRPAVPAAADRVRVYVTRNATAPASTALKRQTTALDQELTSPHLLSGFDSGGASPPTVNNFGGGPAVLRSGLAVGDGGWSLEGDGDRAGLAPLGAALRRSVWAYTDLTEEPAGQVSDGWNSGGFKFVAAAGSTGAGLDATPSLASHPGIARVLCGTTTAGDARLQFSDFMDAGTLRFAAWILLQTLSTSAQRFTAIAGIGQAGSNIAQVAYKDDVAGGAWQLNLIGGVTDPLDDNGGAITVAVSTWYLIEMVIIAGVLEVWINKVQKASGITTGVPSTGGVFPGVRCLKSVGTLSRAVDVDAISYEHVFATQR